jgi:UDP-glucuronate 4-epimerase
VVSFIEFTAMKVLVTGAAGFIGSHLCERLVGDGHDVLGVDAFVDNYDAAIKRRNVAALLQSESFELVEADIRHAAPMQAAMARGIDAVVHLAALAGVRPSVERPALYCDINVTGTAVLLEAAARAGVERFIFGSSSSVYGNNRKTPFAETDRVDGPISPYAASKRAGELLAHTFHHVHGLPITSLRFFTVYGPRQRPDLAIARFMRLIDAGEPITMFGDGSMRRDFTYVSDIVDGVVAAIERCRGFETFNLGSDRPIRLDELITAVERVVGKRAIIDRRPPQPGDVEATWADLAHARAQLGYSSKVKLEAGLEQQWRWFKSL